MTKTILIALTLLFTINVSAQWDQVGNSVFGDLPLDEFGESISINGVGDIVAIGAALNDSNGENYGQVKVFKLQNNSWQQVGDDLLGQAFPAAGEKFGWDLDLNDSGTRLVVGSPFFINETTIPGVTRVFEFDGMDWNQLGNNIEGEFDQDLSGWSVAINSDGSRIITGSVGNSDNGDGSGQVRIYEYNGADWVQIGNDIEGEMEHLAGGSGVEINSTGDMVAVGFAENNDPADPPGKGIVRVYELSGSIWAQIGNDLLGDAEGGGSGSEISMNTLGNRIALGARFQSGAEFFSGQVKVFELQNGSWVQLGNAVEGMENEALGTSVALNADGTVLVAGGRANNVVDLQKGITSIFKYDNGAWTQFDDAIYGENNDDRSGKAVAISNDGSIVAIGAPFNDTNGSNAGQARVFKNESVLSNSEEDIVGSMLLSPNPNKGSFSLNFPERIQNINVSILDITGKILSSETFQNSENIAFNHNLSAGMYFVNVNTKDSEATIKMIVE